MTGLTNIFLLANILLAVSYLIFSLADRLVSRLPNRPLSLTWMRLAQVLFVVSLLLPIVLAISTHPTSRPLTIEQQDREFASAIKIKAPSQSPHPALEGAELRTEGRQVLKAFVSLTFAKLSQNGQIIFYLLTLIFFAMALRLLYRLMKLRQLICDGHRIRSIGRTSIVVTDSVAVPMSAWLGYRAYAILPPDILANSRNFRIAVQHELQHHRHGDTTWALFLEVLNCGMFFNPALYLWRQKISELQEYSCDEALIGQRGVSSLDYGSCLIQVAEAALKTRAMHVGTTCMAAGSRNPRRFKTFLQRRIEMFTDQPHKTRSGRIAFVIGTVGLISIASAALGAKSILHSQVAAQPNPGHAVFDPQVQAIAEDALKKALSATKARGGFVLVTDPLSGRLLATANLDAHEQPNTVWALSHLLAPASTIKGLVVSAAVDQGKTAFSEVHDCENGTYLYGHNLFHDWKPFASLSTTDILVNSSNIGAIKVGKKMRSQGLAKALHDFGFGVGGSTEGFPEAKAGEIPDISDLTEEEYVGQMASGVKLQGDFEVSPLEIVQAYAAIADDGKLMRPIQANDPDSAITMVRQVLKPEVAQEARVALQKAVEQGTGTAAVSHLYTTAGKTGTMYMLNDPDHSQYVASFAGFAPVQRPRVAIYVGIIDPQSSADHLPHAEASTPAPCSAKWPREFYSTCKSRLIERMISIKNEDPKARPPGLAANFSKTAQQNNSYLLPLR